MCDMTPSYVCHELNTYNENTQMMGLLIHQVHMRDMTRIDRCESLKCDYDV